MLNEQVYLLPNVQAEPLFDGWYAWSHLIPPATAARNVTERHIKIMQSYISAPQIHASAVRNPKMLGGPFIDYRGMRVDEIKELLARTLAERSSLVDLSRALEELDKMLQREARGQSMRDLYGKVPAALKGVVELSYDLNNQPGFRVIEPLLYSSAYFVRDAQSLALSLVSRDDRPFVLSTPRLPCPEVVHMRTPFDSDSLDWLFESKRKGRAIQEVEERLCHVDNPTLVRSLFGSQPQKASRYKGQDMRWRYFGHACILLETATVSMLFDPVISYSYPASINRYTYEDLPETIDYVLITHNHQDHVLLETLLQIRHKTRCVVVPRGGSGALQDPSLKLTLQAIGFKNILELDELESIAIDNGFIAGVPFLGEHADLNIRSKLAYVVSIAHNNLLFAADSCNIEPQLYIRLREHYGPFRALFVGMECDGAPLSWLYGPLLTHHLERAHDESRRLNGSNYREAASIVESLGCKEVFVYAMGQEPWLKYIMSIQYSPESRPIVESAKLLNACREQGMLSERLFGEREMILH